MHRKISVDAAILDLQYNATYSDEEDSLNESGSTDSGINTPTEKDTPEESVKYLGEHKENIDTQDGDASQSAAMYGDLGVEKEANLEAQNTDCSSLCFDQLYYLQHIQGNKSLKQKIKDLESKNATLKDELKESRAQLKGKQEENLSLKQQTQDLESENAILKGELGKTKRLHSQTNEVPLEKARKKPLFSRITYVSITATLIACSALSIVSGLFVLSIIATSVASALIAGGITYAISKPTTELKEVDIQDQKHDVGKGLEVIGKGVFGSVQ